MALSPEASRALASYADQQSVWSVGYDIEAARVEARRVAAEEPREDVEEVLDVDADGVPCRLYLPAVPAPGVVVHLHGGGFVLGDLETHDAQCRRMADRTGWAVLAVDYRRPPEDRFPAALDDAVGALDGVMAGRVADLDPSRVVVVGDSAGANLAVGVARRRPGVLAGAVLVYPFLDPQTASSSYSSTIWNDHMPGSGLLPSTSRSIASARSAWPASRRSASASSIVLSALPMRRWKA